MNLSADKILTDRANAYILYIIAPIPVAWKVIRAYSNFLLISGVSSNCFANDYLNAAMMCVDRNEIRCCSLKTARINHHLCSACRNINNEIRGSNCVGDQSSYLFVSIKSHKCTSDQPVSTYRLSRAVRDGSYPPPQTGCIQSTPLLLNRRNVLCAPLTAMQVCGPLFTVYICGYYLRAVHIFQTRAQQCA